MVYQLRHDAENKLENDFRSKEGLSTNEFTSDSWISGSWIDTTGEVTHLGKDDIKLRSISARQIKTKKSRPITLPLDWSINLPTLNRSLTIKPLYDQQWLATSFPYWEGVVLVTDDMNQSVGNGYMELTGYQLVN